MEKRLLKGVILSCCIALGSFEGLELEPYKDSGGVLTVCYGETEHIENKRYTPQECMELLEHSVESRLGIFKGLPDDLPDVTKAAALHFSYHIGVSAFRNSSVYYYLKSGDLERASQSVLKWKYTTINGQKVDCFVDKRCIGFKKRRMLESQGIGNKITLKQFEKGELNG